MGELSQEVLAQRLAEAREKVSVGAVYRHYKGLRYIVREVALLEATTEPCVVYQADYGEKLIWIRPVSDWLAEIEWQGKRVSRFTQV